MVNYISQIQGWLLLILSVAAFALSLISVIHAAVTKPNVFVAADKRTKVFWLAITGGSALLAFLSIPGGGVGGRGGLLLTILPLIGAGVYLTDVRPALNQYKKRPRGGQGGPDGWRRW